MDVIRGYVEGQSVEVVSALRSLWKNKRMGAFQILNLAMIVFSALMMWKAMMVFVNSESPVVVVLSGSMEPAFQRGDVLVLDNRWPIGVGDIVVFKITGRDIPIVHRILRVHEHVVGNESYNSTVVDYLTKGDANNIDDRNLYAPGQAWLKRSEILGKAVLYVPYVGMITIMLNDYPALKFVVLGLMGLFVLTGKET